MDLNDLDIAFSIADDRSRPPLSLARLPFKVRLGRIMGSPEPLNPCVPINLAVNSAIKHQDPDYIVLTGPEILHSEPTLTTMLEHMNHELDYVTARCTDERGEIAGPSVDYSAAGRLPVPKGAHFHFCAMFTPELWLKAGGFDPGYRHVQACDDNDWLWRCERAGARFHCVDSTVRHEKSTTKWNLPHGRDLFFRKWPELRP